MLLINELTISQHLRKVSIAPRYSLQEKKKIFLLLHKGQTENNYKIQTFPDYIF